MQHIKKPPTILPTQQLINALEKHQQHYITEDVILKMKLHSYCCTESSGICKEWAKWKVKRCKKDACQ